MSRGTPKVTLRIDRALWERLGEMTTDRAALIRAFVRWWLREPGAELPRRPGDDPDGTAGPLGA